VRRAFLALQLSAVAVAAALLLLPLPADLVERYYAGWFYPALQAELTSWSNTSAFALFDVLIGFAAVSLLIGMLISLRRAWRVRSLRLLGRPLGIAIVGAACGYLWFETAWGLNYSRVPIERRIGYDASRVTPAALRALAARAVSEVNAAHRAAHSSGFPDIGDMPPALVTALHTVEQRLGKSRPTTPGRPKRTMLAIFFRASGVDGMHAPFLLETLINPDLTPPERPAVLAHEWAHMAGFAPEADASFVGLLAALRADAPSRYSAWLALFDDAASQLPALERRALVDRLDPGPRADREAIFRRLTARVEVIARASWETYDQYLKSQGVREGIQSYSRVVELLLGSGALEWP
jgi:hypothetical protein